MDGVIISISGIVGKIQTLVNVFGIKNMARLVQLTFRQKLCQTVEHIHHGLQVEKRAIICNDLLF
jgi:carbohydrate-selective porin OprB